MKKYTYLVNFDSQTLERVGESFAVKGDGGIAELEFVIPSNFGVPANQALWRVFFKLPGEKESLFETLPTVAATQSGDYVTGWTISKAITQKAGKLAFSLAAISGNDIQWNSRTVIMQVPESQYQPESEEAEEPYTGRLTALEGDMAAIRGEFGDVVDEFEELKETATLGTMPLFGKKIALIGDSITEHNGRANTNHGMWLEQWTGCDVQNLGVASAGFSTGNKYKDRIASIKAGTEIIGVAASLNDLRNPVGEASDGVEWQTVCGYANEFFDLLLASFPSVPIVCYSEGPWERWRPGVGNSDNYMEQMKQICLNKGIAWDDGLYRGCALRPWIQANREALYKGESGSYVDVVDDQNPNSEGQKYIAIYLKGLFEKYVR